MSGGKSESGFLCVLRRELGYIATTRTPVMLMLVLPLFSFLLLWAIFREGTPRDLPVAVCDLDGSSLSRQLTRMVDATRTMRVAWQVASPAEGERLLLEGRIYALVLLPGDLERGVKRGQAPAVVAYTNAQWILPGSLISRDLRAVAATVAAGIDLRQRERRGESDAGALAHLEPVRAETHPLFNPQLNYLFYLVTALLPTMLQIFIGVVAVHAVGRELREGSAAAWLAAAGGSIVRAVAGKFMPYTVGFTLVSLLMITVIYRCVGAPLRGSAPAIVLGTFLFVLAYQAMGLLFIALARNLRLATSVVAFYTSPAFAFVGTTFPTMAMPAFGRVWGALLPLSHYLRLLVEQGTRGARLTASLPELLALLAFVITATALALPKLARAAQDPTCWGRP
jgi:ABC-2 type transport system permease protein